MTINCFSTLLYGWPVYVSRITVFDRLLAWFINIQVIIFCLYAVMFCSVHTLEHVELGYPYLMFLTNYLLIVAHSDKNLLASYTVSLSRCCL